MNRLQLPYEEIKESKQTREELIARSGLNIMELTYPQIFDSHGKLIGGYENLLDYTEQMQWRKTLWVMWN